MQSNNYFMISKKKRLSFFSKEKMMLLLGFIWIVLIPISYFVFRYWSDGMPIFFKIFWPIILIPIFITTIMTPFVGMIITKKGTILFITYFKLKKFNVKDLEKITITFHDWEKNRFSVEIKIFYENGKIFSKDYVKQSRVKNKKLSMSIYIIKKQQVEKIFNKLSDLNFFVITILDNNNHVAYKKDINEKIYGKIFE